MILLDLPKITFMDAQYPVLAHLPQDYDLIGHPHGPAICNGDHITSLHLDKDTPPHLADIIRIATEKLISWGWPTLRTCLDLPDLGKHLPTQRTCLWQYDETHGTWNTSCGQSWTFPGAGDTPGENHMRYCHSCGKPLTTTHPGHSLEPDPLVRIGELLRTQDNRHTADPIFLVQALERIGPICPDRCETRYYYDHEQCEVYYPDRGQDEWEAFREMENDDDLPEHISPAGYFEQWITIQSCFTEDGCKRYLENNGHRLRNQYFGTRIYADGLYRNSEMLEIRTYLMNNHSSPSPVTLPEVRST